MKELIVGILVGGLLATFALAIKYLKWDWLISGYNMMSRERRKDVDIEGLRVFMGNWMLAASVMFLLAIFSHEQGFTFGFVALMATFVLAIGYVVMGSQKYDRKASSRKVGYLVGALVVVVAIAIGGSILSGAREPEVSVGPQYISISGNYGGSIPRSEIASVELVDSMPRVTNKINGFDAGSVKKGIFRLADGTRARLFVQSKKGPFIYLHSTSGLIIINFRSDEKTESLYRDLK